MEALIQQTPGLVQILYATHCYIIGKYSFSQLQEVIAEVKQIQNKTTQILLATLKHEFQSELLRELFYFYWKTYSTNQAYINIESLQKSDIEYDINYIEQLINLKQEGY